MNMVTPIWHYRSHTQSAPLLTSVFRSATCPCCLGGPKLTISDQNNESDDRRYSEYVKVMCCEACGWWFVSRDTWDTSCGSVSDRALRSLTAAGAALHTFSAGPDDNQLTLLESEIEAHLLGHGTSRAWAQLEEVTKGIFREFGYVARVTAKSKDGGIDVIVDHATHGVVYAQIKHTKNKVGVRVLRELIGTMAINGATNSLLVTSSRFTRGVAKEQSLAAQKGHIVELVDGSRLLTSLNLTYRRTPPSLPQLMDVVEPNVQLIWEEVNL